MLLYLARPPGLNTNTVPTKISAHEPITDDRPDIDAQSDGHALVRACLGREMVSAVNGRGLAGRFTLYLCAVRQTTACRCLRCA